MLIAISCVHTARRLVADEPDTPAPRLACDSAVTDSRGSPSPWSWPARRSLLPVFSANILAVAIVGLGLYVASLRTDRHPAFLYLAVGAVVAGRLGAHYFLADRLHVIEEAVRQLLGYPRSPSVSVPSHPGPGAQHGSRLVVTLVRQALG